MKMPLRNQADIDRAVIALLATDTEKPKQLTITDMTRNHEQNAKLHAMLSDIARQAKHAGKKWNVTIWKRLLVYSFLREKGEQAQMIPALDGNGFDVIYERTSSMTVKQVAELIEFVYAVGTSELGVKFTAKDVWGYE